MTGVGMGETVWRSDQDRAQALGTEDLGLYLAPPVALGTLLKLSHSQLLGALKDYYCVFLKDLYQGLNELIHIKCLADV